MITRAPRSYALFTALSAMIAATDASFAADTHLIVGTQQSTWTYNGQKSTPSKPLLVDDLKIGDIVEIEIPPGPIQHGFITTTKKGDLSSVETKDMVLACGEDENSKPNAVLREKGCGNVSKFGVNFVGRMQLEVLPAFKDDTNFWCTLHHAPMSGIFRLKASNTPSNPASATNSAPGMQLPPQSSATTHTIEGVTDANGNSAWQPKLETVKPGDESVWVNKTGSHSVIFKNWSTLQNLIEIEPGSVPFHPETGQGESSVTPDTTLLRVRIKAAPSSGDIGYLCGVHGEQMSGNLSFSPSPIKPPQETEFQGSTTDRHPPAALIGLFEELQIGERPKDSYFAITADINGDGKPDVVVSGLGKPGPDKAVELAEVAWYENPTWRKHVIGYFDVPVALAAADVDGDGAMDIAISYNYGQCIFNCRAGTGKIAWLRNPGEANVDQFWTMYPIGDLLATHRLGFGHFSSADQLQLLAVPVVGGPDNRIHDPIKITLFTRPANVLNASAWPSVVVSDNLSIIHEFASGKFQASDGSELDSFLTASEQGITWTRRKLDGSWAQDLIGEGDRTQLGSNLTQKWTGSGSVAVGKIRDDRMAYIAATEPFHGNYLAVYVKDVSNSFETMRWKRCVVDYYGEVPDNGQGPGHAVATADIDRDGVDEIIVGLRGPSPYSGVYIYKIVDLPSCKFLRQRVSGISAGEVAVADYDGDGRAGFATIPYRVLTYFEAPNTEIMLYRNKTPWAKSGSGPAMGAAHWTEEGRMAPTSHE